MRKTICNACLIFLIVWPDSHSRLAAQTKPTASIIYEFQGGDDGSGPLQPTLGANGILYGVTTGGGPENDGTVYQLTPITGGGGFTKATLYVFSGPDGAAPNTPLLIAADGTLFGTTGGGGASMFGVVFALQPPATLGGAWTETVIHAFGGTDGRAPNGKLISGPKGALYGTTSLGGSFSQGTVFELNPPKTAGQPWSYQVVHDFTGGPDGSEPDSGLLFGPNGELFGGTSTENYTNNSVVFELTPATSGVWTFTALYTLDPSTEGIVIEAPLVFGPGGILYGTCGFGGANDAGTVFQLTPPSSSGATWTLAVLHTFAHSDGYQPSYLLMTPGGVLLGTAYQEGPLDGGVIFQLNPPAVAGQPWTETTAYAFSNKKNAPNGPTGLILGGNATLYGNTITGGVKGSPRGTVYEVNLQ